MNPICFVIDGRDYHAIDWYRNIIKLCPNRRILIATDLIEGEGVMKLVSDQDEVIRLIHLDQLLMNSTTRFSNFWRNILKLMIAPLMAYRLNRISKHLKPIFHAHSMYYIFLCWLAGIKYIATPMGSDVLVRPDRSWFYRLLTIYALRSAQAITVDSISLKEKINLLCQKDSRVIQNGIDSNSTKLYREGQKERVRVMSVRGVDSNYRIRELILARNSERNTVRFDFIYPFHEEKYLTSVRELLSPDDRVHGRVSKEVMYQMLGESCAVFSIPISDSSPRSVYEAIFCGASVVVTYGTWVELLPTCMRARVIVKDIGQQNWFEEALLEARNICSTAFIPSKEALELFDENEAMKTVCREFYGEFI